MGSPLGQEQRQGTPAYRPQGLDGVQPLAERGGPPRLSLPEGPRGVLHDPRLGAAPRAPADPAPGARPVPPRPVVLPHELPTYRRPPEAPRPHPGTRPRPPLQHAAEVQPRRRDDSYLGEPPRRDRAVLLGGREDLGGRRYGPRAVRLRRV